jgi:hypothetical protein
MLDLPGGIAGHITSTNQNPLVMKKIFLLPILLFCPYWFFAQQENMEEIEENESKHHMGFVINHTRIDQGTRKMDTLSWSRERIRWEKSFT